MSKVVSIAEKQIIDSVTAALKTNMANGTFTEEKLTEIIKEKRKNGFKYKKNDNNIYGLLQKYGNEEQAIKYAKRLREFFDNQKYAEHNPCTWVDELVKEIKGVNDDEFKIKAPKDFFSEMQQNKNCY